jgi:hypothetical protein
VQQLKPSIRKLLLATLLLGWPGRVWADSDGYFCHATGFVAWETRRGAATSEHTLHIVRFNSAAGILATEKVALPDFQVHGISCGPTLVELAGWTVRYRVDITLPNRPIVTSQPQQFDTQNSQLPGNLGFAGRSGITDLQADGRTGEFELVVSRESRQVRGGIDHHVIARLVWRELFPSLRIRASRVLMEGIYRETADENEPSPSGGRRPDSS